MATAASAVAAVKVKRANLPRIRQEREILTPPALDSSPRSSALFHSSPKKNARAFRATGRGGARRPAAEVVRPRIGQDLLPQDFSAWSSTPDGSMLLPSFGAPGSRRSSNVGSGAAPRASISGRRCEGSLGEEEILGKSRRDFGVAMSMEDWSGLPPPGAIDKTIYQNLVEMIPLMESFMEQKGRRGFTRHASMVYTPAPPRDASSVKKVSDSPLKSKKNKQQPAKVDSKDEISAIWDEQENILRRVDQDESGVEYTESQNLIEKLNREELVQLQAQIDLLKKQVWEKDSMLETVRSFEAAEAAREEELVELKKKMDEVQKSLRDRERFAQAVQSQLTEKHKDLVNMEAMVARMQREVMQKNDAAARMREELSHLQVQFSAAQFQAQLQNIRMDFDDEPEAGVATDRDEAERIIAGLVPSETMPGNDSRQLETARRMYLGAVITAKQKPGAESIALAAALRKELEAFLAHPYLCGGAGGDGESLCSFRHKAVGALPLI
ncbi:hypothetical protein SELMODRAFT_412875 [Selaginella moellendorffii]|uniref:Uncharacterized protein n=1 Tax=Selaginella moellendorffii TaxID=88036 RepID=D8RML6_SELML|nr:protein MICROTUBULE BINDING PROTEIN 2C [Selaginella moellendorffii]EFJ26557.1 hypothetical protein SELMODRAFT_412875 [Selaginella moellendorffii]|eukprot:XP_002972471.1 protein MICROTUBULE BINDING PROTEIN 2C [Selaginella moellendorffii]